MTSAVVDAALALAPDLLESARSRAPEDQWFERKSARVSPRDLAVPLVAMANADGGVIVVGMHDGVLEDVPPSVVTPSGRRPWISRSLPCACTWRS